MSYRDLRNFSEAMRALGFPQPISLESFREPNFPLVEEIVRWLAERLDPEAGLDGGSASVEQRVAFIRDATGFFLSRANVKVNGRKVYGADGWAVRELLKVTGLLQKAAGAGGDLGDVSPAAYDVGSRLTEIKQARQLATEITAQGAFLHDLLAKEPQYKELRDEALSRPLDMSVMEACTARAVAAVRARLADMRDQIDSVAASEAALDAKLERRRAELQRAEKRLHTVQKIKPAYQSELTTLEKEIESLWDQYVLRYRCVEALKHQLSVLESTQAEVAEEQQAAIMQLIHKYEAEDVLGKLSDSDDAESTSDIVAPDPKTVTRPTTRLRIKTAAVGAEKRRAFGNMVAQESMDDEYDLSDDDLDDKILYGHGVEDAPARWSRAGARPRPSRPATRTRRQDRDDYAVIAPDADGSGGDSLGSSEESELRVGSAAPGRASVALSDNEF